MAKPFMTVDNSELERFAEQFSELVDRFDDEMINTIEYAARRFLDDVKKRTPKKTGNLRNHWTEDNTTLHVEYDGKGYHVYLVNKAEYASWVEHGHYSHNQFNKGGSPYVVKNRTVPYYDGTNAPTFVYGVFYLKKTEIEYNDGKLDAIVNREMTQLFKRKGW